MTSVSRKFLPSQSFEGNVILTGEVFRCENKFRCRTAWELTRREMIHALIARHVQQVHYSLGCRLDSVSLINSIALSDSNANLTNKTADLLWKVFSARWSQHLNTSVQPEPAPTTMMLLLRLGYKANLYVVSPIAVRLAKYRAFSQLMDSFLHIQSRHIFSGPEPPRL